MEEKPVLATLYAASSNPSSSQGISGGMETKGETCQMENRENSLFYCRRVACCYRSAHTSSPLPSHLRMFRVDNVFLSSFDHALPKF